MLQTLNAPGRPDHDETVEKLKALGGDLVINEEMVRQPQLQALVNELGRPRLALNCIGGESAHTIATALAYVMCACACACACATCSFACLYQDLINYAVCLCARTYIRMCLLRPFVCLYMQ